MDAAKFREILAAHRTTCEMARAQAQQMALANAGAVSIIDQIAEALLKQEQEEFKAAGAAPAGAEPKPA